MAYWLLPAEPHREVLQRLIRDLARTFDAPEFQAHVTLLTVPEKARLPREVLARIPKPDVTLTTCGLGWCRKFTKTLFVNFEKTPELIDVIESIGRLSGVEKPAEIDPHLSLLYKTLPEEKQRRLAETTLIPFGNVRFNSICAMRCMSPTKTEEDVRHWQLMAAQNSTIRKGK